MALEPKGRLYRSGRNAYPDRLRDSESPPTGARQVPEALLALTLFRCQLGLSQGGDGRILLWSVSTGAGRRSHLF